MQVPLSRPTRAPLWLIRALTVAVLPLSILCLGGHLALAFRLGLFTDRIVDLPGITALICIACGSGLSAEVSQERARHGKTPLRFAIPWWIQLGLSAGVLLYSAAWYFQWLGADLPSSTANAVAITAMGTFSGLFGFLGGMNVLQLRALPLTQ